MDPRRNHILKEDLSTYLLTYYLFIKEKAFERRATSTAIFDSDVTY